jgi:hypothetical protein
MSSAQPRNSVLTLAFLVTTGCAAARPAPRALLAATAPPRQDAGAESVGLAKKLSNPVAALISVPFQFNYDHDIGPAENGDRLFVNFQPVVPLTLNEDWNAISRTILPVTFEQEDIFPGAGDQSGFGDIVQSVFFSPKEPTAAGLIWGVGPVLLIPTASEDLLGSDQWGLGPTAVGLKQHGPWTYGALANHIWGVKEKGDEDRTDVNTTFLQPFLAYTTPTAWTYSLNSESTYDWRAEDWSVPFNGLVSKLLRVGKLPVQFGVGLRYWAEHGENGPEGWGLRFVVTPLFPR